MDERLNSWNSGLAKKEDKLNTEIISLKEQMAILKKQIVAIGNSPSILELNGEAQRWYDGINTPLNTLGNDGDYYFQIDNCDIYKKVLGNWDRIGNNKGDRGSNGDQGFTGANGSDGLDGTNGLNGATWHDGVGRPNDLLGVENDYYLDVYNGDVYKNYGYWERVGNFVPSVDHIDDVVAEKMDVVREEMDTIITGYNEIVVEVTPTPEDIEDILNMITF